MSQCSMSTFEERCGGTVLNMSDSREMAEQTDWRVQQSSQAACVSDVGGVRSLSQYLLAQSQGNLAISTLDDKDAERPAYELLQTQLLGNS